MVFISNGVQGQIFATLLGTYDAYFRVVRTIHFDFLGAEHIK